MTGPINSGDLEVGRPLLEFARLVSERRLWDDDEMQPVKRAVVPYNMEHSSKYMRTLLVNNERRKKKLAYTPSKICPPAPIRPFSAPRTPNRLFAVVSYNMEHSSS